VRPLVGGPTVVDHPEGGELRRHRDKFPVENVTLVLHYAEPESPSSHKLTLLQSLAADAIGPVTD